MNLGRANKAYVFFLSAFGAWMYAVVDDSPPDEIIVSNGQWVQLIVGVIFATIIGYLTKNADPVPPVPPPPPPVGWVDPAPLAPQLPPPADNVPNL